MREIPASVRLLLDIEARQDQVLRDLEELEARLDRVLAECSAFLKPAGTSPPLAGPIGLNIDSMPAAATVAAH